MSKSDVVTVTPLVGGCGSNSSDGGGVCSLLEMGDRRILLDCGCSITDRYADLLSTVGRLNGLLRGNRLDAILISHADIHHIGLLPMLFRGNNGLAAHTLLTTKIICTTPIYKFGQLVLYDFLLNKSMEGSADAPVYEFDDIDKAFHRVTKAKFNQDISIVDDKAAVADNNIAIISNSSEPPPIVVSALRSGRTIGGSMWRIRSGPTEILYMMDINLKKELVLDGVNINQLPPSPALVVLDGSCVGRSTGMLLPSSSSGFNEGGGGTSSSSRRSRREKDESQALLAFLLQKMRGGSNVLIPCETAGRSLELLQLLGRFWFEQKLGLYHLVFLSHMATNVPEFARTQLEWMSDSLSRSFYNGKPNPFELPQVHWVSSIRQMDRVVPNGPKVVLATDSCLSSGLSKELLLSWGGDPRCCVVFIDQAVDTGSLAADLRAKYSSPPVIATITKPIRVELAGVELESHRAEQERRRRIKEESFHRKRRQQELTKFNVRDEIELVDDEDDAQLGDGGRSSSRWATRTPNSSISATQQQQQQQQSLPLSSSSSSQKASHQKESEADQRRKKTKTATDLILRRFLEPNFVMFESKEEWQLSMDEYGASIADLPLKDFHSKDVKWLTKDATTASAVPPSSTVMVAPAAAAAKKTGVDSSSSGDDDESDPSLSRHFLDLSLIPTKLSQVVMRVQFTCEFREFNLSGRADFKAMKAVTSKITPSRILVLRGGSDSDCSTFLSYAQSIGVEAYAPKNSARVSFQVYTEKLKLHVSQSLLPCAMKVIKSFSGANAVAAAATIGGGGGGGGLSSSITDGLVDSKCSITSLSRGCVEEVRSSSSNSSNQQDMGTRVLRYKGPDITSIIDSTNAVVAITSSNAMSSDEVKDASCDEDTSGGRGGGGVGEELLQLHMVDNPIIGVVSVGEVQLNSLRLLIEAVGISVEVRNDVSKGAILICDDQVMIRKVNVNDYVIEGPPVPAYYEARRVLYQQFAFV